MKKLGFLILLFSSFFCGCGKPMTTTALDFDIPEPRFKMQPLKTDTSDFLPLAWDKEGAQKKQWSQMIYSIIENEEPALLENNPSRDIQNFCPQFNNLTEAQRLNFWGQFFVAVAKPESGWNPISQMIEPNAYKPDPITQRPVKSEGLLQLSYQDEKSHRLDCGFNWSIDQRLRENDGRRTILQPFLNLRCGIKIFARQLKKRHQIELSSGVYWQVLKTNDRSLAPIKKLTNSFELCRK